MKSLNYINYTKNKEKKVNQLSKICSSVVKDKILYGLI